MFGKKERYLITDAKLTPGQDRKRREIQYGIFQFLRVPSLLIAGFFLYMHWWLLAAIVVGVTFPLPWIAVVIGNGRGEKKDKREKNVYKPAVNRQLYSQTHAPQVSSGTARPIEAKHDIIDHEEE
ncbi:MULTISPECIES: DUF3099 domain-containing protein [Corynebacterium]|uniref:DUF3099 domain-containing protein n=1 Tax=Corynebacterium kefirresidentii TaxID=1979527 RepID=A0ABT8Q1L4_9CORY|nr:DUF3099 domain-containing protein [Corynebacterium kefirresidentii]MDN8619217.1 DUF3099 domain-containing protein [Corynebacterium kefirresidentii]MDN8641518.1 DUF3099 domain-containing protein [Corynebacterium kefirresidentii]